jgi:hypothetical protein
MDQQIPTLDYARVAFLATLAGKSPHTMHTYQTGLDRFADYLRERKISLATRPSELPRDVLERFYTWLIGTYGRASRPTCLTYVAGARLLPLPRALWLGARMSPPSTSSKRVGAR